MTVCGTEEEDTVEGMLERQGSTTRIISRHTDTVAISLPVHRLGESEQAYHHRLHIVVWV
jgi:hypothetical protein